MQPQSCTMTGRGSRDHRDVVSYFFGGAGGRSLGSCELGLAAGAAPFGFQGCGFSVSVAAFEALCTAARLTLMRSIERSEGMPVLDLSRGLVRLAVRAGCVVRTNSHRGRLSTVFHVEHFEQRSNDGRPDRGARRGRGGRRGRRDRASGRDLGRGLDPNGDRAQSARDRHPNSPQSSARRRGEATPSVRQRKVEESNSRRASGSAVLPGTNSPRSTHIAVQALLEPLREREEGAARRFGCRWRLELAPSRRIGKQQSARLALRNSPQNLAFSDCADELRCPHPTSHILMYLQPSASVPVVEILRHPGKPAFISMSNSRILLIVVFKVQRVVRVR